MANVLVCGAYFADRKNCIVAEVAEFAASRRHVVEQRWIALEFGGELSRKCPGTVAVINEPTPKFTLMNRLLTDRESFDYIIVADDDVDLPIGFIDDFLSYVEKFKFALSQPARTPESYIDHFITMQMPGIDGRLTRFVEIGPVFCIHRTAYDVLLPFDLRSPMGWGYDYVWPKAIEQNKLRMGIIDATAVGHTIRKSLTHYKRPIVEAQMGALLAVHASIPKAEAFTVLEAYA